MARERRVHHGQVGGPGEEILLDADQSHHLARVLRLAAGDELFVFDGRGNEWGAVLLGCTAGAVRIRVGEQLEEPVEPELGVELFQSLCRPERIEWLIQKATEIGLSALRLFPAERSGVGQVSPRRLERWRRIAREAARQSGRRRVPEVALTEEPPGVPAGVLGLVLDPAAGAPPLGDQLRECPADGVWLAVGPEGGFVDSEVERLEGAGWLRAGLGPRTLRTETAGLVAGAIVLHRWSDLGGTWAGRSGDVAGGPDV